MNLIRELEVIKDTEGFKIQNQRLLLLYKHVKKEWVEDDVKSFLSSKTKKGEPLIIITYEYHEDMGGIYSIAIDFGHNFRSQKRCIFDYDGIRPIIGKITSAVHWNSVVKSLELKSKEEGNEVMSQRPLVSWISGVDILINTGIPSCIYWIYDSGKMSERTAYCKWLTENTGRDVCCAKMMGTRKGFYKCISRHITRGWSGKAFVLNMPRRDTQSAILYKSLEDLKDCWHNETEFNFSINPIIIVLAPWWPNFDEIEDLDLKLYKIHGLGQSSTLEDIEQEEISSKDSVW